ncbi:MAG: ABC transporter ATP-binding protein [Acidimicrobiia bacterium]|nr:ABC transporter ATP-binding protein [Acidimicrobiia bacterium]MDQ3500627.1 ABC transporter ATP-binding protein/permease [Actinomycetota bacterium]
MTPLSTLGVIRELIRYRPGRFFFSFFMWAVVHGSPLLFGILIGQVFDRLAGDADLAATAWTPVAIFAAVAIGRNGIIWLGDRSWINHWNEVTLLVQRNLLRWLLEAPRSRVLPLSPGEAVSTFRDDVEDLLEYLENWVDMGGLVVFGVGSLVIMAAIDLRLTLLLLIPVLLTGVITQALGPQIRKRRRAMREATDDVTGFVGETFGAVQAIKLFRAEEPVLSRFAGLNDIRHRAALADTFLTELLRGVNRNMATIAIAVVLIVAASSLNNGSMSLGELTVFLTYLPRLTDYMAFVGDIIAQHRRTGVAFERIRQLAVDSTDADLLDKTRVPLSGLDVVMEEARIEMVPLIRVSVRNLVKEGVDFEIERGSFTVVTGKIGSGKSTLVRALLGLIPAPGEVWWNGELVEDRASFFVPPRSAYTAQVPRLFSESLADNIALGHRAARERLRQAVQLAVLDPDLERLEQGLETMVGARGVKLSGGQVQRSAAARMLVTEAELLVFDDLSSALDLHTETELWRRLFEQREATCLVVSHRRAALERADQIVLLDQGLLIGKGTLEELLASSPLMRDLWATGER